MTFGIYREILYGAMGECGSPLAGDGAKYGQVAEVFIYSWYLFDPFDPLRDSSFS
jgi:hypothetical protein